MTILFDDERSAASLARLTLNKRAIGLQVFHSFLAKAQQHPEVGSGNERLCMLKAHHLYKPLSCDKIPGIVVFEMFEMIRVVEISDDEVERARPCCGFQPTLLRLPQLCSL